MFDPTSPFTSQRDPLQPSRKGSFAEERLRSAVLFCELMPGTVATEAEIGERFGIGRAGIRVALARLSALGLVHPIPRAGWKVLPVSGALIGDVIAARRLGEPGLADARPGADALSRMTELAEMIAVLGDRHDPATLVTRRNYEREILDTLAGATNAPVAHFLTGLWDHSDRIVRFLEPLGAAALRPTDAGALVAAVTQGDAEAVTALRLADVDAFRSFAMAGLLRDRTELGVGSDAATTRNDNGRQRPETGATTPSPANRDARGKAQRRS